MKRTENKNLTISLVVLMLSVSQTTFAGVGEKFNKYVGSEFTNLSGLYIIMGVLVFGLVGKLVHHYFMKEDEKQLPITKTTHPSLRHQRHHRTVIKKTS